MGLKQEIVAGTLVSACVFHVLRHPESRLGYHTTILLDRVWDLQVRVEGELVDLAAWGDPDLVVSTVVFLERKQCNLIEICGLA